MLTVSVSHPSLHADDASQTQTHPAVADATRQPIVRTLPNRTSTAPAALIADERSLIFEAALVPSVSATVSPREAGVVSRVCVEPAQPVAAGDTLACLEEGLLRLQSALAAKRNDELQTRLQAVRTLEARGMVSAYELERLEYEAAQADLAYQEATLHQSRLILTSPIAGILTQVNVEAGVHVSSGQPCFEVVDPTDLQAELPIPMDRLRHVRVDQPVTARLAPQSVLEGRILRLAPVIDPDTGCCLALARFPSAGPTVLPGSVARITLAGQ